MLHELTFISSLHRVKLDFFSIFLTYLFLSAPSFAVSRGLGFEQLHRRGQPQLPFPLLQQAEHPEAAVGEQPSRWKPSEQSSVPRAFMSSTEQLTTPLSPLLVLSGDYAAKMQLYQESTGIKTWGYELVCCLSDQKGEKLRQVSCDVTE